MAHVETEVKMANNQQEISSLSRIPNRSLTEEVLQRVEEAIRTSVFKPGQKLPSEPVLASQLGVSRNTLREAINILVDKNVLYRARGIGTFVSNQSEFMLQSNLERVVGTSQLIRSKGHIPGQRGFKMASEIPGETIAKKLQIDPLQEVLHISRIRTADEIPVILSEEYISLELLQDTALPYEAEGCDNWSIYEYLARAGYSIDMAGTRIKSLIADRRLARLLEIKEGRSLLCLEQLHFSNSYPKPILYCVNYHNDTIIDIEVVRKG
jgi:GntR family transcriptional regulator